jgi:voltage-gated potassium channel
MPKHNFSINQLKSPITNNIKIPKLKISKPNVIKLQLLIAVIIIFFIYGCIYSVLGENHLNNYVSVIDGFYFSMTTLSTTGYGDITPKTAIAKIIIMTQQFLTIMIMSILLLQ